MIDPIAGKMLTYGTATFALGSWLRSRQVLRHEAIVLTVVCIYFGIGTVDVPMPVLDEWSPRLAIPPEVWSVAGVGSLSYLIASIVSRRDAKSRRFPIRDDERVSRRAQLIRWTGWGGLALLFVLVGAPALTGTNREESSGYLVTLAMLAVPGILLSASRWHARPTAREIAPAAATALLLLLTEYRTYTLLLLLSIAVLRYLDARSSVRRALLVLGGVVAALVVGVGFGYWRFLREGNESGAQLVLATIGDADPTFLRTAVAYVLVGFFREGPAILGFIIDRYPGLAPHTNGGALIGMLTSPLPGQQWDARAILSQAVYGQRETSLVSSVFGPWYLDFGTVGVAIGLAAMGWVLSRVEYAAIHGRDRVARASYAYGLVLFVLSVHSGLSDFVFAVMIPASLIWAGWPRAAVSTEETPIASPAVPLVQPQRT